MKLPSIRLFRKCITQWRTAHGGSQVRQRTADEHRPWEMIVVNFMATQSLSAGPSLVAGVPGDPAPLLATLFRIRFDFCAILSRRTPPSFNPTESQIQIDTLPSLRARGWNPRRDPTVRSGCTPRSSPLRSRWWHSDRTLAWVIGRPRCLQDTAYALSSP